MDGLGRNPQGFAGLVRFRRLTFYLVLQRTFEDVDHLLARMPVSDERGVRADLDPVLDHLASWNADVVALKIGTPEPWCLLYSHRSVLLLHRSADRLEGRSQLPAEDLRLLPRCEVPAPVDLVEVHDVGVRLLDPTPRRPPDLAREACEPERDIDRRGRLAGRTSFPVGASCRGSGA